MAGPLYGFLLYLALFAISAHSQTREPVELEPLKAAFPLSPYTHVDDQGTPYGIAPTLVSIISERIGRKIEVQVMPYLRTLHALKMGQVDIGFGVRARASSVYLPDNIVVASEPQLILPTSFYALPDSNFHIESMEQAGHYRIGSVRLGQQASHAWNSAYDYKDAYSLSKALQAHHVDLATLDPGSANFITQELRVPLERLYDYNHMEITPVFSSASPRIKDPLAFCQSFVETRVELFKSGEYEKILNDNRMLHLLPYYNQVKILPGHCHLTAPTSVKHAIKENMSQ